MAVDATVEGESVVVMEFLRRDPVGEVEDGGFREGCCAVCAISGARNDVFGCSLVVRIEAADDWSRVETRAGIVNSMRGASLQPALQLGSDSIQWGQSMGLLTFYDGISRMNMNLSLVWVVSRSSSRLITFGRMAHTELLI